MNYHLFCLGKTITTFLKAKHSLHATQISSFKSVFIVFFEKKTDAKIYINYRIPPAVFFPFLTYYVLQKYSKFDISIVLKQYLENTIFYLSEKFKEEILSLLFVSRCIVVAIVGFCGNLLTLLAIPWATKNNLFGFNLYPSK